MLKPIIVSALLVIAGGACSKDQSGPGGSGGAGPTLPASTLPGSPSPGSPSPTPGTPDPVADPAPRFVTSRLTDPARTEVRDADGAWLATFTDGARTVQLVGPERTFVDPRSPAKVVGTTWVRLLPAAFGGTVDEAWLEVALGDDSPDILAKAMQYIQGAPPIVVDGLQIAGDAEYGATTGGDFNDYLGVDWTYPDGKQDPAEAGELRHLDCSGFLRMLFGYRSGIAIEHDSNTANHQALPRRTHEIATIGPGVLIVADTGKQVTALERLSPGDLVFFDAQTGDGTRLDHSGFFLGVDEAGHYRYFSSRNSLLGPTFGDGSSPSILDGTSQYARTLRLVRRL